MSRIVHSNPTTATVLALHSPFTPDDVRANDLITCKIQIDQKWVMADMFRISPMGLEIVKHPEIENLRPGDKIALELRIDLQTTAHTGIVVDCNYTDTGRPLIGVRLVSDFTASYQGEDRRSNQRFYTAPAFLPTGSAVNPMKFNDILLFRVQQLSSEGLLLLTSLRNKYLFKDIEIDLLLNFPVFGTVNVSAVIRNTRIVREGDKEYLGLGVELVGRLDEYRKMAGAYLLQFSNMDSLKDLKAAGLNVDGMGYAIDFKYAKTEEDYFEVLKLRKITYAAEGKADPDATIESMANALDSKARIVMGFYKGKLIASAAVIFHEANSKTEHEDYCEWPASLPQKGSLVEINRLCTHPDFRRADLFLKIYKFMLILVAQSKRRHVVICATEELVPLYRRLGFDLTELKYVHTKLGNKVHWILHSDIYKKLSGYGVGPITWNFVLDEILPVLIRHAKDKGITLDYTRIYVYRLFRPLMKLMTRKKPRRR